MVSSSPRPKEGGKLFSERPLRKAISCGSNWPKRRKLERTESEATDPVAGKSQPDSKSSMVSALLETVTEGIRKSKSAQPKSPSPRARQPQSKSPLGPAPARRSPSPRQSGSSPLAKKSTRLEPEGEVSEAPSADKAFSDYGDDDFDDDTLLELDASILGQGDDPTLVVSSEGSDQQANALGDDRKLSPVAPNPVDDEFGDLDDDFLDGAEDLVAEVEARHMSQNTQDPFQGQRHDRSAITCGGQGYDDDDAYGDDFDDDIDFDAVERAATQAAARPPPSNVRTAG
jgi:DNA replication ATP-dependent helicase Dna2